MIYKQLRLGKCRYATLMKTLRRDLDYKRVDINDFKYDLDCSSATSRSYLRDDVRRPRRIDVLPLLSCRLFHNLEIADLGDNIYIFPLPLLSRPTSSS